MINRLSNLVSCFTLVTVFVAAGCEQKYRPDVDVLAVGPDIETISVANDYTHRAIEAAGGYEAWVKARKLQFDCVLTFYKPDGSFYLTEHHYDVYPWSNSIRISADEPQGKVLCQSSPHKFDVVEGDYRLYSLPPGLTARFFAEMILDITAAPARLLDRSVKFTRMPGVVKMEGLWYHPIKRISRNVALARPYSKSVFYQNRDSSRVDMLWFAVGTETFFAVRGYDYHEVEKRSVLVPAKIEIFRTDAAGSLQQRLVKIDCYSARHTK